MPLIADGTPGHPYLPGDIVSFTGNAGTPVAGDGHVAIVTASTENSTGNGTVTVLQQNASPASESLHVRSWSLQMPSDSWVTPYQFDAFASSAPGNSGPGMSAAGTSAVAEGPSNSLYFWWATSGTWHGPIQIGAAGTAYSAPAMNAAGNAAVAQGPSNSLYYWWATSGTWHGPIQIGAAGTAY